MYFNILKMIKKIRSEIIQFLKKSNFKHLAIHNHVVHNASREFQKNNINILFPHLLLRIFCRHLKQKKFTKKHNQKITKKKSLVRFHFDFFFSSAFKLNYLVMEIVFPVIQIILV